MEILLQKGEDLVMVPPEYSKMMEVHGFERVRGDRLTKKDSNEIFINELSRRLNNDIRRERI